MRKRIRSEIEKEKPIFVSPRVPNAVLRDIILAESGISPTTVEISELPELQLLLSVHGFDLTKKVYVAELQKKSLVEKARTVKKSPWPVVFIINEDLLSEGEKLKQEFVTSVEMLELLSQVVEGFAGWRVKILSQQLGRYRRLDDYDVVRQAAISSTLVGHRGKDEIKSYVAGLLLRRHSSLVSLLLRRSGSLLPHLELMADVMQPPTAAMLISSAILQAIRSEVRGRVGDRGLSEDLKTLFVHHVFSSAGTISGSEFFSRERILFLEFLQGRMRVPERLPRILIELSRGCEGKTESERLFAMLTSGCER